MVLNVKKVEQALRGAGFSLVERQVPFSEMGTLFEREAGRTGWKVSAYVANPPQTLDVTLQFVGEPKGTQFKVLSDGALGSAISQILSDIDRLLANEDLMKCPACGIRYVHVKHGPHGDFLSCDGMRVTGSRARGKSIPCRGISTRIPPTKTFQ